MTWETWIALGLLALAGVAVAVPLAPDVDRLEERCGPPLPDGEPVDLDVRDTARMDAGVARREIVLTPAVESARVVVRACPGQDVEVMRAERAPEVRIALAARGHDPDGLDDDAEVKARAVLGDDGTVTIVPRIELHGRTTLPQLRIELVAPAQADARVEWWP